MTATHGSSHHHHEHDHDEHEHQEADWHDDDFVEEWIKRQADHREERRHWFSLVRAVLPKTAEQEFRYLDLGAGDGELDELLLEHFKGAAVTLVDTSLAMLTFARARLQRFGERVEYVHADLSKPAWTGALAGPFDAIVSTMTVHHLGSAERTRQLYADVYRLAGHGGMFLNLDLVRPARSQLDALVGWAAKDGEAHLSATHAHSPLPGTLVEHLGWLGEAGFGAADVLWKNMNVALLCAVRDHLHLPEGHGDHGHDHGHSH